VAEAGFPGFEAVSWFGLFAPAGTPPAVVGKLHQVQGDQGGRYHRGRLIRGFLPEGQIRKASERNRLRRILGGRHERREQ
jgi:hypothetical protein